MSGSEILRVDGISKRFGGVHALDDVSVTFRQGSVHTLAGENGSGKSTLIKVISGVEVPDAGTITLAGRVHHSLTPRTAIREGIQIIYQDLSLFPNITVAENIALAPMLAAGRQRFSSRRSHDIATSVMDRIGVRVPLDAMVADLRIAERQLTAICRALAQDARILFMDEPTTALTRREVESLFTTVERLRDQGVAVVFVSHKFNEVLSISDEITVLRNGRVVAEGKASDFDRASLSTAMTGQEVDLLQRQEDRRLGDVVLETRHLSSGTAFRDVSIQLHKGEILGITGLLGSGRDAVAESIFGLQPVTSGSILIEGHQIAIDSIDDAINAGIAYVPGDRLTEGLFLNHPVGLNIVAASIRDIPRTLGTITRRATSAIAKRMVKSLDVKTPDIRTPVRNLSGGNQQRIVLAKWLVREPKVLMLNGPTVGVDIGSKREIMTLLRDLGDRGAAVIVISDDVSELAQVCDRILVMRAGAIATELRDNDIEEDRIMSELVA
jgi:simple sugar transport system ATP-binding protein